MTPEQFKAIQRQLAAMTNVPKITNATMADIIGKHRSQVDRYRSGDSEIPAGTVRLLDNLIDFMNTGTFGGSRAEDKPDHLENEVLANHRSPFGPWA